MRICLELVVSRPGRLKGRLATADGSTDVCFNGTLELLRLLEALATEADTGGSERRSLQDLDERAAPRERA